MKPPYVTMCMSPHAKESLLKHQNLSVGALSEPNINLKKTLAGLNTTIEEFFRKYTFKLNEDYYILIYFILVIWEGRMEGKQNWITLRSRKQNQGKFAN